MFIRFFLRRNIIVLLTVLFTFTGIQTALAADQEDQPTTTVVFTASCDGATIVSTKDISNVVVLLGEYGYQAFEEGRDFDEGLTRVTLAPDAGFEGMIDTVYVNSDSIRNEEASGSPDVLGEPFHCGQPV